MEVAQHVAAEEIMSYVESAPILKEAAHAKALEEHAEWAEILGVGYSDTQRRDLIYKHLKRLLAELHHITGGDATKVGCMHTCTCTCTCTCLHAACSSSSFPHISGQAAIRPALLPCTRG